MYCRECGNELQSNAVRCSKCSTQVGYGVNYCHNCGYNTNAKLEFCRNCGAKLSNKVSVQKQTQKINELNMQSKKTKKMVKVFKRLSISCVVIFLCLVAFLVLRPQPANIPDARKADEFLKVGNVYYYDSSYVSEEVASYWAQSRAIISYIVCSIFAFIVSFISKIVLQNKYNRLIATIKKEKKNVL